MKNTILFFTLLTLLTACAKKADGPSDQTHEIAPHSFSRGTNTYDPTLSVSNMVTALTAISSNATLKSICQVAIMQQALFVAELSQMTNDNASGIDVFLQTHQEADAGETLKYMAEVSNQLIQHILVAENYPLVTTESSTLENVTFEGMVEEVMARFSAERKFATDRMVPWIIETDPGLTYTTTHPGVTCIGGENATLYELFGTMQKVFRETELSPDERKLLRQAMEATSIVRSELLLAKSAAAKRARNVSKIGIVIGFGHQAAIETAMVKLGWEGSVRDASAKELLVQN